METVELNVVTAAVLAEIAFDAAGDATNFSSKRYRETLEDASNWRVPSDVEARERRSHSTAPRSAVRT
jgi:hypothetical protein